MIWRWYDMMTMTMMVRTKMTQKKMLMMNNIIMIKSVKQTGGEDRALERRGILWKEEREGRKPTFSCWSRFLNILKLWKKHLFECIAGPHLNIGFSNMLVQHFSFHMSHVVLFFEGFHARSGKNNVQAESWVQKPESRGDVATEKKFCKKNGISKKSVQRRCRDIARRKPISRINVSPTHKNGQISPFLTCSSSVIGENSSNNKFDRKAPKQMSTHETRNEKKETSLGTGLSCPCCNVSTTEVCSEH